MIRLQAKNTVKKKIQIISYSQEA